MTRKFVLITSLLWILQSPVSAEAGKIEHSLEPGETRARIAERYGVPEGNVDWGPSLEPGKAVEVKPGPEGWPEHQIQKGQTLWAISRQYDVTPEQLRQANRLEGNAIKAGQKLFVPVPRQSLRSWVKVRLEDGTSGWVERRHLMQGSFQPTGPRTILALARRWLGTPYSWGGQTPNGADCSGFVHEVYRLAGYSIARTADKQFEEGQRVERQDLEPGDLVFFETYAKGASHVGIYAGGDTFLHASSRHGVTESSLQEDYYQQRFLGARRIR